MPSHVRILFNNSKKGYADINISDTTISAKMQNSYIFFHITFLVILIHKLFIFFIHT